MGGRIYHCFILNWTQFFNPYQVISAQRSVIINKKMKFTKRSLLGLWLLGPKKIMGFGYFLLFLILGIITLPTNEKEFLNFLIPFFILWLIIHLISVYRVISISRNCNITAAKLTSTTKNGSYRNSYYKRRYTYQINNRRYTAVVNVGSINKKVDWILDYVIYVPHNPYKFFLLSSIPLASFAETAKLNNLVLPAEYETFKCNH